MFADTNESETIFAPVIQAGMEALKVSVLLWKRSSSFRRIKLDKLQKFLLLMPVPSHPASHNGKRGTKKLLMVSMVSSTNVLLF